MQSQIPIGNVAYGLAWSFFVNYLRYVLPGKIRNVFSLGLISFADFLLKGSILTFSNTI